MKRRRNSEGGGEDLLDLYLDGISGAPRLSEEETVQLSERAALGDFEARDRLVSLNLRLVVFMAKRYTGRGVDLVDLISEGNLGLLYAAENYGRGREISFKQFAADRIQSAMQKAIANHGRAVRLPASVFFDLSRWLRTAGELKEQFGFRPTNQEVAAALRLSEDRIETILAAAVMTRSLDDATGEPGDSPSLSSVVIDARFAAPNAPMMEAESRQETTRTVQKALAKVGGRSKKILRLRFGLDDGEPKTCAEIGERVALKTAMVAKIVSATLCDLQREFAPDKPTSVSGANRLGTNAKRVVAFFLQRQNEPIAFPKVCAELGIPKQSVHQILTQTHAKFFERTGETVMGKNGQPAALWRLRPDQYQELVLSNGLPPSPSEKVVAFFVGRENAVATVDEVAAGTGIIAGSVATIFRSTRREMFEAVATPTARYPDAKGWRLRQEHFQAECASCSQPSLPRRCARRAQDQ